MGRQRFVSRWADSQQRILRRETLTCGLVAALLCLALPASANSPWPLEKGALDLTPFVIYETFDEFYKAEARTDFPPGRYKQIVAGISLEYGVFDDLTVDLTLAYVRGFGDVPVNDGLYDTHLGLRYRILDEFESEHEWMPTLSFRFGGIIAGSYEVEGLFPGIPGDKASGIEGEFLMGKLLPHGVGIITALGLRARELSVPLEWHFRIGAFKTFFDSVVVSAAFDQWRATSGIDIGGPGFTPDRFRELKEITQNIEVAIAYTDRGGRYYSSYYTRTVGGRNTGIKNIVGGMITIPISVFSD